ncbi:MAG: hypothetical protein LBR21_00820 [Propionibacteriaceae bacterium]|jgi:hypothetical protein|nr:hypothetical protein [Propionibacteriaceae bacterium]
MTWILALLAAGVATAIRFAKPKSAYVQVGVLALMFWGATLMWTVDGIANLIGGQAFIELIDQEAMLDDTLLGLSVLGLGIVLWLALVGYKKLQAARA